MNVVQLNLALLQQNAPAGFNSQLNFVMDQGNSAERNAQKHFQYLKTFSGDLYKYIGSLTFEDDKDCPPLQAADMMAWHTRRALAGFPNDPDGSRRQRFEKLQSAVTSGARGISVDELLIDFNRRVNALAEHLELGGVI